MDDGNQRRGRLALLNVRWVLLLLLFILAVALRVPRLSERPMHNDEAVNAIKFGQLWEHGSYKYDPNEHHGPTLYYATVALAKLTGAPDFAHFTENRLRLITVIFGFGLLVLLPWLSDGLGPRGVGWAALFTAVSPALVFYSRYYIHEMLLVFSALLALTAGWRYWRSRKLGWALLAGLGLGLMHATKETFLISLAAAVMAMALNQAWNRWLDASGSPVPAPRLNVWHLAAALGVWVLVAVIFFSSFFSNARGLIDSFRTYGPWLSRAGGQSEHIHPWNFYLQRLLWFHVGKGPVWTEALLLLLGLVGAGASFFRKQLGRASASFCRFLALYTLFVALAYTVIGYKTTWCLLNFWQPLILLAGFGAAVFVRTAKTFELRVGLVVLLLAVATHLGWQAVELSAPFAADQRNPYVYAQTSPDILNLTAKLESLAAAHPQGHGMLLEVIAPDSDYWPLPWYLRRFKNVGWYDHVPREGADAMIVSARLQARLDEARTHLMVHYYALRPQVLFELYVAKELWQAYLAKKPAISQPD